MADKFVAGRPTWDIARKVEDGGIVIKQAPFGGKKKTRPRRKTSGRQDVGKGEGRMPIVLEEDFLCGRQLEDKWKSKMK